MNRFVVVLLCMISLYCCVIQGNTMAEVSDKENNQVDDFLSESVISDLLNMDLWNSKDIQDASHVLMIPMHCAYKSNNGDL